MPAQLTQQDFIQKSIAVHGDKYAYDDVVYTLNSAAVTIRCPQHGPFTQRASNHMLGRGCPRCKAQLTTDRCKDDRESFIAKAKEIHGDTYDYSRVVYERSSVKVEIICQIHGSFWQRPNSHITRQSGCEKCAGRALTTDDYIAKAKDVHGDKYDYHTTIYRRIKDKIYITCKKHGPFYQTAESHLIGRGCTQCWHESYASKAEIELAEWVESLGLQVVRNYRGALPKSQEVDIYLPDLKVGIEYNGSYWHSDKVIPSHQHKFKHDGAESNGVRIIAVWDMDWRHNRDVVKRHLIHAFGLDQSRRIHARKCRIKTLTSDEAAVFYRKNHIQGPCRSAIKNYGLVYDGVLVAAMSFTKGGSRRGKSDDGEWELARYATSELVRGGASKLFNTFVRDMSPKTVWSFSDRQHFSGDLYPSLGFVSDGIVKPDYRLVDSHTLRVWHKSLWQRRCIPKRLKEIGSNIEFDPDTDPRTEKQIQEMTRVVRVWDAGKIRWMWRPTHHSSV